LLEEIKLVFAELIDLVEYLKEQKLLKLLIENRKNSVSFETIMANVWEDSLEKDISFGSVKNLVSTLRKKLPKDCICSIYGVGYQIN